MMALSVIASALSSCVNEEYDVDNLNTEVTLVSEGLTLPLGTTKPLTLKSLFSDMDAEVLQVLDGGAYALCINDKISLGDQIPSLDEMLEIPDMKLPELILERDHPMGIWEYGESAKEMEVDVVDIHLMTSMKFNMPDNIPFAGVNDIYLGDLPETVVDPVSVNVIVKSEAPEGISNISDVKMTSSSMMKITLSLQNSFLTEGEVVPDMVLDFSELMTVDGGKRNIDIADDFILNADNGYSASRSFNIETVDISESDWDGTVLDVKKTLKVSGKAAVMDAVADLSKIAAGKGGVTLKVDVEFSDIAIESITMDIDDIEVAEHMDILLELDEMTLPEGIKSIEKVVFKDGSYLDLILKLENIDRIAGLEARVNRLEMTFPEEIIVKEAVNGKLVITDVNLSEGLEEKIHIEEISFPDPVNGKISYCADIKVDAIMTAGGRICSADLPSVPAEDAVFKVKAKSCFDVDHFKFDIDGPEHKLELEPFEFTFEIPDDIPAFMKGDSFVLDLANPHLVVKAKTNIGIPVKGTVVINPVTGGVINEDGQVKATISLPYTETASEVDSVMFWFAKDKAGCPAGYTFVEADISKLIRRIPDEIRFSLTAGTDPDASCVIEPSADYILDFEYDLVVPLEFGKDLHIEFTDTLEGVPDILGQLLEKNPVQLSGSITSSLPVALEMKLDMLDLNDNLIPVEKPAVQVISACDSNGKAVNTPLDLTLDVKEGTSSAGLSSIKVTFVVTSPGLAGVPVDEEDFVQADIKFSLPEGITVDAETFNSDQN